ncbi:hypothetical protein BKA61DRAFT_250859 [Leptodontidium sp. MPI-SDFR-AT-0119]|nr:hypothetical protein BKA61DRAFT_250859 [Leptodontidium sp. MPI-SDFR-AT-0119]
MELKDMEVLHKIPPIFGRIAKYVLHPEMEVVRSELLDNWYENVVPEYCHRALSHKDDKLPAISGIAKAFQNRLGYTYVAGLWLEDIAYGLCWATEYEAVYPAEYRAPTWAWTSVDGNVHWPGRSSTEIKHYVHIEDYYIQLARSNPFGRISGGWLKLSGFIGHGIVRDEKLLCSKSDVELGYPYLDADRDTNALKGMEIRYLILSTANGRKFNRLRALILRERERGEAEGEGEGEGEFDRIGSVVSADMDVHLNAGWFEKFCVRTTLKLF